jgi:hypothetical protein
LAAAVLAEALGAETVDAETFGVEMLGLATWGGVGVWISATVIVSAGGDFGGAVRGRTSTPSTAA